jgi:DNA polymerase-3 subunit epsilon
VIAAHNVYFDMGFLRYELGRLNAFREVPHVCTRFARPILGLAACSLDEACRADRVGYTPTHSSRTDATAAAGLWLKYRDAFLERRIITFRDLTSQGKKYKFFTSFGCDTIRHRAGPPGPGMGLKPRGGPLSGVTASRSDASGAISEGRP